MKLQNLYEGIQSRTQATRRKRQLRQNTHAYGDLVQEIAKAVMPMIEQDETRIYGMLRDDPGVNNDELPDSVEGHLATISEFFLLESIENDVAKALHVLWDKKWGDA